LIAGVSLFVAAMRAVAQGTQDFFGYSVSNAVEGIAKVCGIGLLIAIGLHLGGGIVGFLLGPLFALVYLGLRLRKRYANTQPHRVRYDWRRILNAGAGAAAATIAVTLMGSADVILVKHFFDAHAAGLYAAASLGGKMLLYLVGFIPTVLLPQAADRHARGAQTREVLVGSLLMFALVALCGLFVFRFFGTDVLHALVGRAFDAAAPLLVTYGLAMVMLALTNSLTFYGIATHRLAFTVPLFICTFGTLGAIAAFHTTLRTVVEIMVVGNFAAALAVAIALVFQRNANGRRSTA
jgi:O-antigen/teichoic acid export membrane protein